MKSTGMTRQLDHLGRLTIPKEMRVVLSIDKSDPLEVFTDDLNGETVIVFKKYQPGCIFCGDIKNCINHKDKFVCKDCIEKMGL